MQNGAYMSAYTIHVWEVCVGLVVNEGEIRSRQHNRIDRQFVGDPRQRCAWFRFAVDYPHVAIVNGRDVLLWHDHLDSVQQS